MPKLADAEIDAIEQQIGVTIPAFWRSLLVDVGYGRRDSGAEIYHPSVVRESYEPFFDDPSQVFNPYFPFGCHNGEQTLWIINASTGRAATIFHETVPDDWPAEEWLPFETWSELYLKPAL